MEKGMMFLLALVVFAVCGCGPRKERVESELLKEQAVVVTTIFTPSRHDIGLGFTVLGEGEAGELGMDFNGNVGIGIGDGVQISKSTIPEKYGVVFRCQHGEFVNERKMMYERFRNLAGARVEISYREIYEVTYDKGEDGKEKEVKRDLVDLDFIDAVLAPEQDLPPAQGTIRVPMGSYLQTGGLF